MSHASLYPGFIKLFYTVSSLEHIQTLPVLPYEGVGGWWVQTQSSTVGMLWNEAVDLWVAVIDDLYNTAATSFLYAELWTYESVESDPVFRASHELGDTGASATVNVSMQQGVMTFRTDLGGLCKIYLMENIRVANEVGNPPNFTASPVAAIRTFVLGATGFIVGRDGSFPIAAIRWRTKTNDALRRKRQLFS